MDDRPVDPAGKAEPAPGSGGRAHPAERRFQEQAARARDEFTDKKGASEPTFVDKLKAHPFITGGIVLALVAVLIAAVIWWLNARHFENTDDAFIDTRTIAIGSAVAGTVVSVGVTDNQDVDAGTTLLTIDPRDYQAAVAQAKAQVDQAKAGIENLSAQIEAQQANIEQAQKQVTEAQAALQFSQQENQRSQQLVTDGAGTKQRAQQTASDLEQKKAALAGVQSSVIGAQKQIDVLKSQQDVSRAQLEQAQAQQTAAQANLARATITAPVAGHVTKLTAAKGVYAQPGQALMMFVPGDIWITANFKETQLTDMRPGQPVDISIDAYPGHVLKGHVDSIQAGSGAVFSLLPPENATGNFVKVVQRVPVKIVFDKPPDVYLGPGMSVVPTVRVR